jgi:hypothetical protein
MFGVSVKWPLVALPPAEPPAIVKLVHGVTIDPAPLAIVNRYSTAAPPGMSRTIHVLSFVAASWSMRNACSTPFTR